MLAASVAGSHCCAALETVSSALGGLGYIGMCPIHLGSAAAQGLLPLESNGKAFQALNDFS